MCGLSCVFKTSPSYSNAQCKSPYAAHWRRGAHRCPNLFANDQDKKRFKDIGFGVEDASSFRVKVIFDKDDIEYFDSLAHLWSEWYGYYLNATYPHLIVRFEDMLLQVSFSLSLGAFTDNAVSNISDSSFRRHQLLSNKYQNVSEVKPTALFSIKLGQLKRMAAIQTF